MGRGFVAEEDRPGGADRVGAIDELGRWVGVADLDVDLEAGTEGLAVGVEERAMDLEGVEDLTVGAMALTDDKVAREFGVEDLEGLVDEGNEDRPVGVADLRGAAAGPPDDEGLLLPILEEFRPDVNVGCLDATLPLEVGSGLMFASCSPSY